MATPAAPTANPATFEVTRSIGVDVHNSKFRFGKLYLRQIFLGPETNQSDVIVANPATGLGQTAVNDWAIYDGLGSQATLVARAQGMHTMATNWQNWFTIVFEDQRFKGSTLQVMGASLKQANDWAIVGGTGDFEMAQGVIRRTYYKDAADEKIHEITIYGYFCMSLPPVPTPTATKSGPWGGNGALKWEMSEKSQRLDSLTIRYENIVEGIIFSYFNEDGQLSSSGRWGQHNATAPSKTINFGPSEVVTGITGMTYTSPGTTSTFVSSFKIITNVTTYGPFGTFTGPTFTFKVPANKTVVGFFANSESATVTYFNNIGVYLI